MVSHGFEGPCEGEDQNCGNHLLESRRNGIHALRECEHPAAHEVYHYNHESRNRAERQSVGSVAACERLNKFGAAEESAGVYHAENAQHDQHRNREYQVDDFSAGVGGLSVILVDLVAGGEKVAVTCVQFVSPHWTKVESGDCEENYHQNSQQRIQVVGNGADEQADSVDAFDGSADSRRP